MTPGPGSVTVTLALQDEYMWAPVIAGLGHVNPHEVREATARRLLEYTSRPGAAAVLRRVGGITALVENVGFVLMISGLKCGGFNL